LLHGSAKSHFKQRICQADARFFTGMSFLAARFVVESFALMSQLFLPFSEPVGELFVAEIPREKGPCLPVCIWTQTIEFKRNARSEPLRFRVGSVENR
jgi:hypothetical protein